jgi:hypothetical protein
MIFRQLMPVAAALVIFFTFVLGGAWMEFVIRWLVAPAIVLILGALLVSLFVAFLSK